MTKFKKYALYCIIFLLVVLVSILTPKCCQKVENDGKTVYVRDTLTEITYDTVYLDHYKTVKLPIHDTTLFFLTDTLTVVDSVEVDVPIYHYVLDTSFVTDTTVFNLSIRNSGFNVSLDTLSYSFQYTPTLPKKTHRFGWFIGPSLGLGYDFTTGKPVPTIGVGIGIGISTKRL